MPQANSDAAANYWRYYGVVPAHLLRNFGLIQTRLL